MDIMMNPQCNTNQERRPACSDNENSYRVRRHRPVTPHPKQPPPKHHQRNENDQKHHQRDKMCSEPGDELVPKLVKVILVPILPRPAPALGEEDPRRMALLEVHDNSVDPVLLFWWLPGLLSVKLLPQGCLEPLSTPVTNSNKREYVVVGPWDERVRHQLPERMLRSGAEDVVAEGALRAIGYPCRIVEKGF